MSFCKICGSNNLRFEADNVLLGCDVVECNDCGTISPSTPWHESNETLARRITELTAQLSKQQHDHAAIVDALKSELIQALERVDRATAEATALKAQVEQLRIALKATRQPHMDFIPALNKTAQQVLEATPDQCLAERDAEVVEKAISLTRSTAIEGGTRWLCRVDDLEKYANQLRQQAKGGE